MVRHLWPRNISQRPAKARNYSAVNLTASKPACKGGFFLACLAATIGLVLFVWLVFLPALPGILHFDDIGNLEELPRIVDIASAWRWIQEGRAGPFGRPLALATFALQYYQWPFPEAFLRWNIALHVINALLVFWLATLMARRMGLPALRQVTIGFFVALTWAALPLLNTSVLFIVQRMALLSSTFMLAGLIVYLKCRDVLRASWLRQLGALSALAVFGVLALFSKENGALVVIYALVLELALITIARERRLTIAAVLLLLASLSVVAGMAPHAFWHACAELTRGFDLFQRLGSQGVLLPVYLKGLFLPLSADLNPFRFEFLLRDNPNLQWGVALWLGLMVAPLLAWWFGRKHTAWRWAALAMAWFFYGHLMESSWVSLEPYFAHRNYLPAIGLVFALVYGTFAIRQSPHLWRGAFAIYVLLLGGLTWMNTSLWGDRTLAAEIWVNEQPRSVRAVINLAYDQERTQGAGAAQSYLDQFMEHKRDSTGLRIQSLFSACRLEPESDQSEKLSAVKHAIATLPYEGWATDLVEKLMETVRQRGCNGVSIEQVGEIAAAFLAQPAYQCSAPAVHNMNWLTGLVAMDRGDTQQARDMYFKGLQASVSYVMAAFYFDLASQQGDMAGLEKLQSLLKRSRVPRGATKTEWKELQGHVDEQLRVLRKAHEDGAQGSSAKPDANQ